MLKAQQEHRGKPFQEQAEADASEEGRVTGSKMLETPPPHSFPNICSREKELAEPFLSLQQGPSVLSPSLLGAPRAVSGGEEGWKSKVVEGSAGLRRVYGGQAGTQTPKRTRLLQSPVGTIKPSLIFQAPLDIKILL